MNIKMDDFGQLRPVVPFTLSTIRNPSSGPVFEHYIIHSIRELSYFDQSYTFRGISMIFTVQRKKLGNNFSICFIHCANL